MNLRDFTQMLDGREYDYPQFTKEEIAIAKENGFVINLWRKTHTLACGMKATFLLLDIYIE